jgi:hypothetical protein
MLVFTTLQQSSSLRISGVSGTKMKINCFENKTQEKNAKQHLVKWS